MDAQKEFKPDFLYDAYLKGSMGIYQLYWRQGGKRAVKAFKKVAPSSAGQEQYLLEDHTYLLKESEILAWANPVEMIRTLDEGDIDTTEIRRLLAKHGIKI